MSSPFQPIPGRAARPARVVLLALAALAPAACDFPTELPKWDTTWVVPAEKTRILVDSILPAGMRAGAGATFSLGLSPATVSRTLGQLCGAPCTAVAGQTVPRPQFTAPFEATIVLPRDVQSVAVTSSPIQVRVQNDLGFDPLRPSATARGYVVLTASSGGRRIASDSIAGEASALLSGSFLTRTLSIGAETLAGPIDVGVRIFSPAGDPVLIDPARTFSVTATPASQVTVTQAVIAVSNRRVIAEVVELDLDDFDSAIIDRTRGGALVLISANPFDVVGTGRITLVSAAGTIQKQVEIRPGNSVVRAELSESEMRSILGQNPVRMSIDGAVTASSGSVTVRPGQAVEIETRLELKLGPSD